jgi:hypothetical protein
MHIAIVLACMTTVLVAAIFQYRVVMGYAPQVRFFVVPSLVGLFFGLLLVVVRRMMVVNGD